MSYALTQHAQRRKQQRGFKKQDIALIMEYGSRIHRDLQVLTKKDVASAIRVFKRRIQDLERLGGGTMILKNGMVLTCYHLDGQAGKRALRGRKNRFKRKASASSIR